MLLDSAVSHVAKPACNASSDVDIAVFALAYPDHMQSRVDFRDALPKYKLELAPVVTTEDIDAFEQYFGVELPTQYQMFLRFIGNGIRNDDGDWEFSGIPYKPAAFS